ncbi:MAG: tetratricopeptide repeat protein [Candidatus Competibacteraceae bacterium]|nr:tetratricopeptide repeat protein [Candidatus Competibacteraceae bacterium]
MSKTFIQSCCIVSLLLGVTGCVVVPPSPQGGAPVVDRTLRRPPAPQPTPVTPAPPVAPPVEVNPLSRPEPIRAQEYPPEPLVVEEPVVTAPVEPPPPEPPPPAPTPQPIRPTEPQPAQISREGNQAVVALLDSAANYVDGGDWNKAGAALERALRIEPRNAGIWHDLAQIRLQQRQYQQAESLAAKSNSLSGNNNNIKARNWRLIAVSRRAAGNSSGADAAEAQATLLER